MPSVSARNSASVPVSAVPSSARGEDDAAALQLALQKVDRPFEGCSRRVEDGGELSCSLGEDVGGA